MEMNYTFFCKESNVVCIIIFLMMLMRDLHSVGRQTKQIIFVNITISHILYFISDMIWVLIMADYLPHTRLSASLVNISNAILLCAITGFWFVYVELAQGEQYITHAKARILALIPGMVETVGMIFLFTVFPNLFVDEKNNMTTCYYLLFISVPVLYICVSADWNNRVGVIERMVKKRQEKMCYNTCEIYVAAGIRYGEFYGKSN